MKLRFSQTSGMVEQWFFPYGMPKFFMKDGDEIDVDKDLGEKLLAEYPDNLGKVEVELPKKVVFKPEVKKVEKPKEKKIVPKPDEKKVEEKVIPSNYFKLKSEAVNNGYDKTLGFGKEELIKFLIEKGYVTV